MRFKGSVYFENPRRNSTWKRLFYQIHIKAEDCDMLSDGYYFDICYFYGRRDRSVMKQPGTNRTIGIITPFIARSRFHLDFTRREEESVGYDEDLTQWEVKQRL
jgi:hypothetical protein